MACATLKRNWDWESVSQLPVKRRRCAPFSPGSSASPGLKVTEIRPSAFGESVSAPAKLTPERISQEIWDEIERLRRRRQLRLAGRAVSSSSSGSEGDASPPHPTSSRHHPASTGHSVANRALFTFKQMRMICEKLLRDQEESLRAEYEGVLSSKLAEQYEAFVRFNLDQVQRRPPAATCLPVGMDADQMHQDLVPSYLS